MRIIIHKDDEGRWVATRDSRVELAAPEFRTGGDLARWCKRKYPFENIGINAADIGPRTAAMCDGAVLWLSKFEARWPYLGGGNGR